MHNLILWREYIMTQKQTVTKLMVDMRLRNFSDCTIESYLLTSKRFLAFTSIQNTFDLCEKQFREYLVFLLSKNLQASSINFYNCVIRFLYEVTLEKDINYKRVPHMKKYKKRPEILTVDELASFFANLTNPKHLAFFLNMYGSGLRISEMLAIKASDIDGKRMLLRINCGKGRKERYAPLTLAGYEALRYYWKTYRPENTNNYLFPDSTKTRTQTSRSFQSMYNKIANISEINKNSSSHTLRHNFATHSLQSGLDLMTLKEILGHTSLSTTSVYLHLFLVDKSNTKSPEELTKTFWDEYRERSFLNV
jgi:site-specific recombinase XerD